MAIFATMHIFTYPWKAYGGAPGVGGTLGWRAIVDAYNPMDLVKVFIHDWQWVVKGRKEEKGNHVKSNRESEEMGIVEVRRAKAMNK